jgi:hypothetical protein
LQNPKTTILGYLLILASVISYGATFFQNHTWPPDLPTIMAFIAGLAAVFAKDGGH